MSAECQLSTNEYLMSLFTNYCTIQELSHRQPLAAEVEHTVYIKLYSYGSIIYFENEFLLKVKNGSKIQKTV